MTMYNIAYAVAQCQNFSYLYCFSKGLQDRTYLKAVIPNLFRENERYCSVAFKTAFRFSFNKKKNTNTMEIRIIHGS